MPSPVGHALAAMILNEIPAAREQRRRPLILLWMLAVSSFPDLDIVAGMLFNQFLLFHRGLSHSLGFILLYAIMVSAGTWAILKHVGASWPQFRFRQIFGWSLLLLTVHLFLDYLTVTRLASPFLWPLIAAPIPRTVQILLPIRCLAIRDIFSLVNLHVVLFETLLFAPVYMVLRLFHKVSSDRSLTALSCRGPRTLETVEPGRLTDSVE
jgi:membrane-bound metal-dependent hydrolase YbcI (DUF457 family)